MKPINPAVNNAARNYFLKLAGAPDFKDLKAPTDVSHTSGELAPGRPGSDPNTRVRMAEDRFQSLVDSDKTDGPVPGGAVIDDGLDRGDIDPRPAKIHRFDSTSNKWNTPALTVADFTGDPSNGYAISTTMHLGEDSQPIWVTHEAMRIQNGQAQTLTMEVFNKDDGSRPQIVVNVADMDEGSPNIGSPGHGTFQRWEMNGEQLGYLIR